MVRNQIMKNQFLQKFTNLSLQQLPQKLGEATMLVCFLPMKIRKRLAHDKVPYVGLVPNDRLGLTDTKKHH